MQISFSDTRLRSLQPPARGQIAYWDEKLPSFGIRVSQGGTKTFVLNHRKSLITIGRYPIIGLAEARGEAKRLLAEFTLGNLRPNPVRYVEALKLFLQEKEKSRRPKTTKEYRRLLNRFSFQSPVAQITDAEVARQLGKIEAPAEYNHALVTLRVFFNWTIKRKMRSDNPTLGLSTNATVPRSRVLTDEELKAVWTAASKQADFGVIVKLLVLTGQRKSEIAALEASWINLKAKTIMFPAAATKNGREHSIPISTGSAVLLAPRVKDIQPEHALLFPARGSDFSRPFNGFSKSKAMLDKLSGVTNWTLHDLRRTFATRLAELGVAPHIIERLLNHVSGTISGVAAIYNRYSFAQEMREALKRWETRLRRIIAAH